MLCFYCLGKLIHFEPFLISGVRSSLLLLWIVWLCSVFVSLENRHSINSMRVATTFTSSTKSFLLDGDDRMHICMLYFEPTVQDFLAHKLKWFVKALHLKWFRLCIDFSRWHCRSIHKMSHRECIAFFHSLQRKVWTPIKITHLLMGSNSNFITHLNL